MQEIGEKKQLQNNKNNKQFDADDFPQCSPDGHLFKSITVETIGVHEERCWPECFHVFPMHIKPDVVRFGDVTLQACQFRYPAYSKNLIATKYPMLRKNVKSNNNHSQKVYGCGAWKTDNNSSVQVDA